MKHKLVDSVTPGLINCQTETRLWLSWQRGHIILGQSDTVGRRVILSYQDMDATPLSSISVSTAGNTGLWRFPLSKRNTFHDLFKVALAVVCRTNSNL